MKTTISSSLDKSMYNFCINYIGRKAEERTPCITFYCDDPLLVVTTKPMAAPR